VALLMLVPVLRWCCSGGDDLHTAEVVLVLT
jgi:hypothetical protein